MLSLRKILPLIATVALVGCSRPQQPAPPTAEEAAAAVLEDKTAEEAELQQQKQSNAQAKK